MILNPKRRAKIVATVGPAIDKKEMLLRMAQEGVDVFRLNFSHGNHADFERIILDIREIEEKLGRPVGILADIQGPKVRVGKIAGGGIELKNGDELIVTIDQIEGGIINGKKTVSTTYKELVRDVPVSTSILLDDGLLEIKVEEKLPRALRCIVINGGLLKPNKGINVPAAALSANAITEKDYEDILFCVAQNVDFIAMSFVRTAQEVRHLKQFVESRGKNIEIFAKIEMRDALANLDEIIDTSDGILVARGDLAIEVGNERVPVLQKQIVRKCNLRGKAVIIATQMLMSMVDNPRPSRAEASDVANAVVDGTDALMLSNETAIGKFPVETIQMMSRIIVEMEAECHVTPILFNEWQLSAAGQLAVAILQSAVRLNSVVDSSKIVVVTRSGYSALLVSKCRPSSQIIAITESKRTYRQLSIKWGIEAICMEDMGELISQTAVFEAIGQRLLALNLCTTGDRIVITAGLPRLAHGSTNTIKVHQV